MAFRMFRFSKTMACAMAAAGRSRRKCSTPSETQARRARRRLTTITGNAAVLAGRCIVAAYWLAMAVAFSPLALLCWLADSE